MAEGLRCRVVDREKVLSGLKSCADSTGALCRTCPYDFVHNENCMGDMAHDALELMTEQQNTIQEYESLISKIVAVLGLLGVAEENKKTDKNPLDSLSEAELIEPMKHFQD